VEKIILSRCHRCQPVHELILVTKPGVHKYQAQVTMATKFSMMAPVFVVPQ